MSLCAINVAFPFAEVSRDPVGGAEQVLSMIDRGLCARGGRSVVLARKGSRPAGELAALPSAPGEIDTACWHAVHEAVRDALSKAISSHGPDVVHLHGVDFYRYLPPPGPPVLVTLHLPLDWYPAEALRPSRPDTWLTPVSWDQARRAPAGARMTPPIENGVDVEAYRRAPKGDFVLAIGRICPEKGFHLALDAARAAGRPMLLAGAVFPYPEHRRYFEAEIRPRLDGRRRWIGPVTGRRKHRLMAAARCLVTPSLAPETSSLVAREALAAGTPVVGLRSGALVEAVDEGRTGILVERPEQLPDAIREADRIDPEACRSAARARFSARRMVDAYLAAYGRLAARQPLPLIVETEHG